MWTLGTAPLKFHVTSCFEPPSQSSAAGVTAPSAITGTDRREAVALDRIAGTAMRNPHARTASEMFIMVSRLAVMRQRRANDVGVTRITRFPLKNH